MWGCLKKMTTPSRKLRHTAEASLTVHLNGLLFDELVDHVVKELNVEESLKLPIFVVQKAAAPKNGVEGSNGTIRSSLATLYDVSRRRARSPNFEKSEAEKLSQTD